MSGRCLRFLGWGILAAGLCRAGNINSLHVQLGSWNGSSFSPDGSDWNTYNGGNWAIGATAPGFGNPVLDGFNSVNLPDGEYFLYMASNGDTGARAVQITLGYSGGGSVAEVFTDPNGALNAGSYTLAFGSGFTANLVTGPQTAHTAVGSGQTYSSTGQPNWIIDLNSGTSVPEPGSWRLLAAGLASFVLLRRKKTSWLRSESEPLRR
jgi:hypothetical protein